MSVPHGTLNDLLRLLDGQLSAVEETAVRDRLQQDPQWDACWSRVRRAHEPAAPEGQFAASTTVTADLVAGFVDGTLSPVEAAAVEDACWSDDALLREVVSAYQFDSHSEPLSIDHQLTERLKALVPPLPSVSNRITDSIESAIPTDAAPPMVTPPPRIKLAANGTPRRDVGSSRRRPPYTVALMIAAVAAGVTLAIGLLVGSIITQQPGVEQLADTVPHVPTTGRTTSPPEPQPEAVVEEDSSVVVHEPEPSEPDTILIERDAIAPVEVDSPEPQPAIVSNEPPTADERDEVELQWISIEGIVAARESADDPWHGAEASSLHGATTFATPAKSWAAADCGTFGQIVMGANTILKLKRQSDVLEVAVERGRAAMRDLALDQEIIFQTPHTRWRVRSLRDKSAVAVLLDGEEPQLIVRQGMVTTNGTRVRQGRMLTWSNNDFGRPEPTSTSTAWIQEPDQPSRLPREMQKKLLLSRDLRSELMLISRSNETTARALSTRWALAMFPNATIAEALAESNRELRGITIRWLMSLDPTDSRVRHAFRILAERTSDAQMVRTISNWKQQTHAGRRVTSADAAQMVRGLNHASPAVRHFSAFFLESAFGARIGFDPDAAQRERRQAIQKWTKYLRSRYSNTARDSL
jgi:hypothetical protein